MSTDYGYLCVTHDDRTGEEITGGSDTLREVWRTRHALALFFEGGMDSGFELRHYRVSESWLRWLAQHHECDIVIVDEYGREKPMEGECPTLVAVMGRTWRCQRGPHASGKHSLTVIEREYRFSCQWES